MLSVARLSGPLTAAAVLAGCASAPALVDVPSTRASTASIDLPLADPSASIATSVPAQRPAALPSNSVLARDFMELSFALESGRPIPQFSRFEGPITISLGAGAPPTAAKELARLVQRLRNEAGIAIAQGNSAQNHIQIEFVPRSRMTREVPNAACFVVPNARNWAEYRATRRTPAGDWAQVKQRRLATVFIPAEATPQEVRDCLHEETSQALGPLNDLYRLPDSVWNDDNFHTVLTRYDMMQLRATYAADLKSGMSAPEVQAKLPTVFARLNPQGGPVRGLRDDPTPRSYVSAVNRAIGPGSTAARRAAAMTAIQLAAAQGWHDTRAAFGWFALGRLSVRDDPMTALHAFERAGALYRATPGAGIQTAHVDMQLAAFALSSGRAQDALALSDRALAPALKGENATLTATLYMIRAEAYDALGNTAQARRARLDSAQWARYGFGSAAAAQERATEVAALAHAGRG
ncbi:ATP-dependent transcriptional regulator [Rhodobacter sp. TJ_12]|nr:ATP-dependent transcriptional regulator [Rhodobacter sp. TJ_12]